MLTVKNIKLLKLNVLKYNLLLDLIYLKKYY